MVEAFLALAGEVIDSSTLTLANAAVMAEYARSGLNPYVTFVESRTIRQNGSEVVVLDLDIEVPQHRVFDIRPRERVAVSFCASNDTYPNTVSLRDDFPLVPHLNLNVTEFPRSFCLYDEPWKDLRLIWTVPSHLERTREWLRRTALGEAHDPGQPLEPLILGRSDVLVLPSDLSRLTDSDEATPLQLLGVDGPKGQITVRSQWDDAPSAAGSPTPAFIATVIQVPPSTHGIIRRQPETFEDLNDIVGATGADLIQILRRRFGIWRDDGKLRFWLDSRLVMITLLPKKRTPDAEPESTETWAFVSLDPIKQIGKELGLWDEINGEIGWAVGNEIQSDGRNLKIGPLNPIQAFTQQRAAWLNGEDDGARRIVLVGVGALGSQVFLNMLRSGFGEWTLVDDDVLLPHNLARHGLLGFGVGRAKADALADLANITIEGKKVATALASDIFEAATNDELRASLEGADVILDGSASYGVTRFLARDVGGSARRASFFLNRTGTCAVLLVEDAERNATLDTLEMQFHRAILERDELREFMAEPPERLRYGLGCRDHSTVLSQDLVALHAAAVSRRLKPALKGPAASITAFVAQEDGSLGVISIEAPLPVRARVGEWQIATDRRFLTNLMAARSAKLPNETGGVLIGSFDMEHRMIYVAHPSPSPDDSTEWPTVYIRGCQGLRKTVNEVERKTGGNLRYIGEWHSHPHDSGSDPSASDAEVMQWLHQIMAADGLPSLMVIAAEHDTRLMLDSVSRSAVLTEGA